MKNNKILIGIGIIIVLLLLLNLFKGNSTNTSSSNIISPTPGSLYEEQYRKMDAADFAEDIVNYIYTDKDTLVSKLPTDLILSKKCPSEYYHPVQNVVECNDDFKNIIFTYKKGNKASGEKLISFDRTILNSPETVSKGYYAFFFEPVKRNDNAGNLIIVRMENSEPKFYNIITDFYKDKHDMNFEEPSILRDDKTPY